VYLNFGLPFSGVFFFEVKNVSFNPCFRAAGLDLLTKQLMINLTGKLTKSASSTNKPPGLAAISSVRQLDLSKNQSKSTMPLAYYKPVVHVDNNERIISTLI
jgi:hypothetical protein